MGVSVNQQELPSVKYSCPSELPKSTSQKPKKPSEEPSSSSQVDKRSSSPESSVSPILSRPTSTGYRRKERSSQTVSTSKLSAITDLFLDSHASDSECHSDEIKR